MHSRMVLLIVLLSIGASGLMVIVAPEQAEAIPAFSRQTEKSCSTCHDAFPKLNQTGQNFRTNGFRFPEDKEWNDVQDLKHVPLSAEIEVEAEFNKTRGVGASGQETLVKIDEVALLPAPHLGKKAGFPAMVS